MFRLGTFKFCSKYQPLLVARHVHRLPPKFTAEMGSTVLVAVEEARRFIMDCLRAVGVPPNKVRCVADFMVAADYRGVFGSGLNRLEVYLNDLHHRHVDITAEPTIIRETVATAHVNGNSAMGVVVGNFCMDLAVEKAKQAGIGFVVARKSHHFGMAAWYVFRAMRHGFIGLAMSNAAPLMVPPGAQVAGIGSNCLAFGAKALDSHFLLDMSTTVKDIGAIEWAFTRNHYLPHGWAADDCGESTAFPSLAFSAQRLFPAGGHKGYCLAAMIDLLCGVMSGANYASLVPRWWTECQGENPNLGQIYVAIDPCFFVSDFKERLEDFNDRIKSSCPIDEANPVLLPGELEKLHMRYVDELFALPYPKVLLDKYKVIADMLCVEPMRLAFEHCETRKKCH